MYINFGMNVDFTMIQLYNLSPGIATPMGPTSLRRLEFIALRYLQDYMFVTHLAIPLKEAL